VGAKIGGDGGRRTRRERDGIAIVYEIFEKIFKFENRGSESFQLI
jgi:hypothetical protein